MTMGNLRKSFLTLVIIRRTVPVLFFLTAAPNRGKTIIVRPCDGSCLDLISFLYLCIDTYFSCRFTLSWWYDLPCGRCWELAQERACTMMSLSPQPVVMGHSVHLCIHPLHRCLQWASSNCWHQSMPSCKGWYISMNIKKDVCSITSSLNSPPTSTSEQHTHQCSLRW
jgi:hypothetical protein